jgi:hypothetical protein
MRGLIVTAATCAAVLLVGLSGCGGGDVPRGRIHGKLTVQGKPVPNLAVVFLGSDNRTHSAVTAADGAFAVEGVALGTVKVSVQAPMERSAVKGEFDPPRVSSAAKGVKDEKAGKSLAETAPKAAPAAGVGPQYADPDKSGLTFELKGPDQEWSTDLK